MEAARAGEAGRGFAVVASEISQLAAASQEAANNIQRINAVVTNSVTNLSDNANGLVSYINDSILPEFERFVESGVEYNDKASFIEGTMTDFKEKTDSLKQSMLEISSSINTISHAINEGVNGVVSAADSTQLIVEDMDNISHRIYLDKSGYFDKIHISAIKYRYLTVDAQYTTGGRLGFRLCLV